MSSIIHSLSDLATSLIEVVWSLFTTAGDLAQKTVEFVLRFFTGAINLVIEFFKGLVDLAGGIVQFVLGESTLYRRQERRLTDGCRQHRHARYPGTCLLRIPAVPAQPGQVGPGWKQEAELGPAQCAQ